MAYGTAASQKNSQAELLDDDGIELTLSRGCFSVRVRADQQDVAVYRRRQTQDQIVGDLEEKFIEKRVPEFGLFWAKVWYWRQATKSIGWMLPTRIAKFLDVQVITFATSPAGLPSLDAANRILIPEEIRRECESAIDIVADLLAVTSRCRRSVLSGTPWATSHDTKSSHWAVWAGRSHASSRRRAYAGKRSAAT